MEQSENSEIEKKTGDSIEKKSEEGALPTPPSEYIDSVDSLIKSGEKVIPMDMPPKECVDHFFVRYDMEISEYSSIVEQSNKIDYLLIKRFLLTAYNNLVEMDLTISQGRVVEPYNGLQSVESIYKKLIKLFKKPIADTYSLIFLKQQKSYQLIEEDLEEKRERVQTLDGMIKRLTGTMDELKSQLARLDKSSQQFMDLEYEYKKKNTIYSDTIHSLANLKDDVEKVTAMMIEFKNSHQKEFTEFFNLEVESKLKVVLELLNSLSFMFDQVLWEEARGSNIIRNFFKTAKIEGSFSSKTYLQYFLKNIGEDTKNEEHKKLRELLKYLESTASKHLFVLGGTTDHVSDLKVLIESIDKDYTVVATGDPDKLIVEYTRKPFNLIIIDDDVRCNDIYGLIKSFWDKFEDSKRNIPILLRFEDPTYEQVNAAGKNGIRNFMFKYADEEELLDKIKGIL